VTVGTDATVAWLTIVRCHGYRTVRRVHEVAEPASISARGWAGGKRVWRCREPLCQTYAFPEQQPAPLAPSVKLTARGWSLDRRQETTRLRRGLARPGCLVAEAQGGNLELSAALIPFRGDDNGVRDELPAAVAVVRSTPFSLGIQVVEKVRGLRQQALVGFLASATRRSRRNRSSPAR
jgi:hypothetical protein